MRACAIAFRRAPFTPASLHACTPAHVRELGQSSSDAIAIAIAIASAIAIAIAIAIASLPRPLSLDLLFCLLRVSE